MAKTLPSGWAWDANNSRITIPTNDVNQDTTYHIQVKATYNGEETGDTENFDVILQAANGGGGGGNSDDSNSSDSNTLQSNQVRVTAGIFSGILTNCESNPDDYTDKPSCCCDYDCDDTSVCEDYSNNKEFIDGSYNSDDGTWNYPPTFSASVTNGNQQDMIQITFYGGNYHFDASTATYSDENGWNDASGNHMDYTRRIGPNFSYPDTAVDVLIEFPS